MDGHTLLKGLTTLTSRHENCWIDGALDRGGGGGGASERVGRSGTYADTDRWAVKRREVLIMSRAALISIDQCDFCSLMEFHSVLKL